MPSLFSRVTSYWRQLRSSPHREAAVEDRTQKWERKGPRGLPPMAGMSLDLKLAQRMLFKHPGLSLVGGVAIAVAICVGAGTFELLKQIVFPQLPLSEGDRIVAIRHMDAAANQQALPRAEDVARWREEIATVEGIGGFRTVEHNLIIPSAPAGTTEPVQVAEISAAGFRVSRVPPLLGRPLLEQDEQRGAPDVLVLGYDLWQRRFGGDPEVVGQQVQLGATPHTVVGVMPRGFAFPVAHRLWTPLRLPVPDAGSGRGPAVRAFGRLAPGVTLQEAQAELSTLGRRAAVDLPETHEHLRPQVLPYAKSFMDLSGVTSVLIMSTNLFLVMLLTLVFGNVALLMFARTASRAGEIVVRNALGASRGRIMVQLFVEALVLAGIAAAIGLITVDFGIRWIMGALESGITELPGLPFWIRDRVSPVTLLYTGLLTVLGALVAGVFPTLKLTRSLGTRLRRASAGGGGYHFGGGWTPVIIAQIAITVAFPAVAFILQKEAARGASRDVGFATEEYLAVRLGLSGEALQSGSSGDSAQAGAPTGGTATLDELDRRLESDPAILGVTFAEHMPRMNHPDRRIEIVGGAEPADSASAHKWVALTSVANDYFDVLGVRLLAGRSFHPGDSQTDARAVIVNESFVGQVFGGRNPIGQYVRYVSPAPSAEARAAGEPLYQIVGVAPDLGMSVNGPGVYHRLVPGAETTIHMAVRARNDPEAVIPRVRAITAEVEPTLRLHDPMPLDRVNQDKLLGTFAWLVVGMGSVGLLLSLATIYAVMSFTVERRTREIGIRTALGADARRLVTTIFRRPLTQVGLGILLGSLLVGALSMAAGVESAAATLSAQGALLVVAYSAFMLAVCILACVVPTRRALGIEPTDALRAD